MAGRAGWYHHPLDVAAMQEAFAMLIGTHDFSSFRAAECQAKSPVRTLAHARVAREGELVRFELSGQCFPPSHGRNIVGALVTVGSGKAAPSWMSELLAARDRTRWSRDLRSRRLYFCGADYDARFALPPTRREASGHEDARQDLRHHARRRRARRDATPARMRSGSISGAARRASLKWVARARSPMRCRRS
jgi:tRNA pseudouridine38-40 synthase